MNTKALVITIVLFGLFFCSQSQVIEYCYDNAGNRTKRHVITLGPCKKDNTEKTDSTKQEEVLEDQLGDVQFNMYPNPLKEQLTVTVGSDQSEIDSWENASMELYDLSGRLIYQTENIEATNVIDFSNHPYGTYIVRVIINNNQTEWKVIKQ